MSGSVINRETMRTNRISDFRIAEYLLRLYCTEFDSTFVDLPVVFKPEASGEISGGILFVSNRGKLSQTLFQIVAGYLNHSEFFGSKLDNALKSSLVNMTAAIVRDFTYSSKSLPDALGALPATLNLNRDAFVWLAMRNIICPAFQKPIINLPVVAIKSDTFDGAKLIEQHNTTYAVTPDARKFVDEIKANFLFVNMEVENYAARSAFLLFEAIRGHGLDPRSVCRELMTKAELKDRFFGLVRMSFVDDEDEQDFIFTLGILSDMTPDEQMTRTAQVSSEGLGSGGGGKSSHTSFWQFGLIEKLLEPDRGMDYSVYWRMKPFTDKLWAKVEKEKRERGLKELPLELLLRVQSEQYHTDPTLITQALLADNRVW